MKILSLAAYLSAAVTLLACDEASPAPVAATPTVAPLAVVEGAAAPASVPEEWQPAAVQKAAALAEQLRANGVACDDYELRPAKGFLDDYHDRLKVAVADLPLAESRCTSAEGEDLTFMIFTDAARARAFVEVKRQLLCSAAAKRNLTLFPGFPYVVGDTWFVEPDERMTSATIAPILGGTHGMASCADFFSPKP